jgi:tRNA threonylcarbamoyladenosine biosynthesis protein TsaE
MKRVRLSGLAALAQEILERLPQKSDAATLVALSGELGAGKTTFVQALAKELGVKGSVQSPTYVLMKSYPVLYKNFSRLVHVDLYRLEKPEEFAALKPEEFLNDQHNLVCLEWPERASKALPKPDLTIKFSSDPPAGEAGGAAENERYIEIV